MTNKRVQSRVAVTGIGVVSPNRRGLGQFTRVASGEPTAQLERVRNPTRARSSRAAEWKT